MKNHKKQRRPTRSDLIKRLFAKEEGRRPMVHDDMTDLCLNYWLAFDTVLSGESEKKDWATLSAAINVAIVLAERSIGSEYLSQLLSARDGLIRAQNRGDRYGIWRLDGEAMKSIRIALTVHDAQVKISKKEELKKAVFEVRRRVDLQLMGVAA